MSLHTEKWLWLSSYVPYSHPPQLWIPLLRSDLVDHIQGFGCNDLKWILHLASEISFFPSVFLCVGPFSLRACFLASCSLMFTQLGWITFLSVSLLCCVLSLHGPMEMASLLHPYQLLTWVICWQTSSTEVSVNAGIHRNVLTQQRDWAVIALRVPGEVWSAFQAENMEVEDQVLKTEETSSLLCEAQGSHRSWLDSLKLTYGYCFLSFYLFAKSKRQWAFLCHETDDWTQLNTKGSNGKYLSYPEKPFLLPLFASLVLVDTSTLSLSLMEPQDFSWFLVLKK